MATKKSTLESLPIETQHQIISWLESDSRRNVLQRIAKPHPEGFGIQTHLTSLNRFYARHLARERAADSELAPLLAPGAEGDPVQAAIKSLTSDFAFHIATNPKRKLDAFRTLAYWTLRSRELEHREREVLLIERRLSFHREKWEYDIARQVLLHHAELEEIRRDSATTDEEKINRARATLFNLKPEHLPT